MNPARRELTFASLRDAVADADRLLAGGYDKAGNWSLGQVTFHLSEWVRYLIDGYPMKNLPWLLRATAGRWMFKRTLKRGRMGERGMTVPESIKLDTPDAEGVERFRALVARWENYTGPLKMSPLFGHQDKATWERLHAIHAAHHLSFLIPKAGA